MIDSTKVLAGLPSGVRSPLIVAYQEIAANYIERRWEPSELNGGKFCEVAYTVVYGALLGQFSARPSKPANMADACWALEDIAPDPNRVGDRSLRILIPRTILPLYEIRNNRGVGHVGGDVDPNFLDATAVLGMASWILAELVRIFHAVSTREAQLSVDALIERKHPLIWEVGQVKRILDAAMKAKPAVLVLLHQHLDWVSEANLFAWTEYSNLSVFRAKVLGELHEARLIEYDRERARAHISPLGITEVESSILRSRA